MRHLGLALLLFLILGLMGCAGTTPAPDHSTVYHLRGSVTQPNGSPLAQVSVALIGSPHGSMTNAQGAFGITGVRPGRYRMVVLDRGFESDAVRLDVPGGSVQQQTISMHRSRAAGAALADSLPPVTLDVSVLPGG